MMPEDQFVTRIRLRDQRCFEPSRFDPPFAQPGPHRVDEDQQQIIPAHEVGKPLLPIGSVSGQERKRFPEQPLAHRVVGRVIAGV